MDLFRALGMGGPLGGVLGGYGGGQGGLGGLSDPSAQFKAVYRCYPVVMAGANGNKAELEAGNKIILPSSALDTLARLRVTYPMMFKITNKRTVSGQGRELSTHCGVMEFSAEEGTVFLPYWMMQNLLLESGGLVEVANVSLRKGSYVKFQPHSIKFTQLHNPRVVLERALRNFSCLTKGETIAIQHGQENFYMDVTEVKPGTAISIIETDVNVDFDPPKDMPASSSASAAAASASAPSKSASSSGSSSSAADTFSFHHQATNATAAQRDFSTGGWGSAGTEEEEKAAAAAAASKAASASSSSSSAAAAPSASAASATPRVSGGGSSGGASDYFSKLGSGNKLTGKRSASGASSSASSAASSLQGSPALGAVTGAARASPPPSSLGPTAASAAAAKLSSGAAAAGPRPQSALAGRAGGYSLTGKPVAGSSAASSSSSSSSAARPPSASAASAAPSSGLLGPTAGTTKLVERQGNFDYHYEVDVRGHKRLVRRLPAQDKPAATATAAKPPTGAGASASSSSAAAPAGGLLAGKGYSLK